MLSFTGVIAASAFTYTMVAIWQLEVIGEQVDVMSKQSRALEGTLIETQEIAQATKDAADAAKRNAEAAERNVEAAVEFLRLEQRAWVGITIIKMRTEFRPEEPIRFEVRVENTGITPALCIVVKKIVSSDPPNENTIDAPIDEPEPTKIVISPRNAFSGLTKPIRLTEKEVEVVRKKRARIYVFGTIHYRDIFDRKHKTTYCTFYTAEHHPNVEFCPWFNHMD